MSAWSHLPNAHHIDRVIESVNSHPEIWLMVRHATKSDAWDAAWDMVWEASWGAEWHGCWSDIRDTVCIMIMKTGTNESWSIVWPAIRAAVLSLIAYNDSIKYLAMTSEQLRIWSILSEDPAATLLLPAIIAFERINELETV